MEPLARTSITRTIRRGVVDTVRWLLTADGERRTARSIRNAGLRVPRGPYRVTYRLDPIGKLEVWDRWVFNPERRLGFCVCFLPPEWERRRVTRTVTPLKGGKGK